MRFGSVTGPRAVDDPIAAQRAYYARTSGDYDRMHDRRAHDEALRRIPGLLERIGARTVLDTGCGTGLAMMRIAEALPDVAVRGNDPSAALLDVARDRNGIAADRLDLASSDDLPYADGSYDAVVATGVLHHVPDPVPVVAEMLRVARLGVFISDSSIYGQPSSPLPARMLKLGLARTGLLRPLLRGRRGGHEWYVSEEDGVAWSYSLFDSLPQVRAACAEVRLEPTVGPVRSRCPILFVGHGLLIGLKAEAVARR